MWKKLEARITKNLIKDKPLDYTTWEKDFGFLYLLLEREKNIVKNFFIAPMGSQLPKNSPIKDEDINPQVNEAVETVWNSLSDNYTSFLVNKYFKDKQALIEFITEDIYISLTSAAITANDTKLLSQIKKNNINNILSKNMQQTSINKKEE